MRKVFLVAAAIVCGLPSWASAQGGNATVQGFGGLTFGSSPLGGTSTASSFGGAATVGLTPNIQIVGEGGRLSDIKSSFVDLLDLTPIGLRVAAWHAEGGVRFIASPHLAIRPYTEATAGFARLRTSLSGFDGRADPVINAGFAFLNRTEPLLGLGGGIVLGRGPVAVDVGYRYKRIMATGLASAFNAGNAYDVNEARIGLAVRF